MKQIIFALLFPVLCFSQKTQTIKDDKFQIQVTGDYIVEQDTTESGVITLTFIPTISVQKDIESKLGTVNTEIDQIDVQITELRAREKTLRREKKEFEAILDKIGNRSNKDAVAPKVKKRKL